MSDGFETIGEVARRIMDRAERDHVGRQRDELNRRLRESVEVVDSLTPVERALLHADQMQSYVRSLYSDAVFTDPLSVLAAEVRRLRAAR